MLMPKSKNCQIDSPKFNYFIFLFIMVEPLLSGIVLGLVPVTIAGLFVTAYLQYRRGDQATF
jgi:cytochrome b6-f complex subunit 5